MTAPRQCELVVIGAGGAGLAAAIEAARAGAKVVVFEKGARPGGTTAWSVGSYTSSATPHQQRNGVKDGPEAHFADMDLVNARAIAKGHSDNLVLRRLLTDNAPDTFQWLMDLGMEFIGPNPEPPHTQPRMHNILPNSSAFPHFLLRECRRLGVSVECDSELVDIELENGVAVGVSIKDSKGVVRKVSASRAIILATGDFAASVELRNRFFGPEVAKAIPVNPLATGDGIRIAESHGARIINAGHANAPRMRFVPAPQGWIHKIPPARFVTRMIRLCWERLPQIIMRPILMRFLTTALGPEPTLFKCGAMLIDAEGNPVPVDEENIARHLACNAVNKAYIVFDSTTAAQLERWPNFVSTAPGVAYAYLKDYRVARRDIYFEGPSIEALAGQVGISARRLGETVDAENLKRATEGRPGLVTPPYFALGPACAYITIMEGGIDVDEQLRVLGAKGTPIPRLYAAGSTGQGGLLIEGHGHHIAWAFVSGRLAGKNAVVSAVSA